MKETAKILSNRKDVRIVYDLYVPKRPNKVLVQIAHGMAEHRGRYQEFCEHLCEEGFTVVVNDHRGHGDSVKAITDRGDMGEDGFDAAVDDLHKISKVMLRRFSGYQLVLLGHSMGSLLVRRYLQVYDEDVKAVVLSGSPSSTKWMAAGKVLASLIGVARGERHRSPLLNKLSFGNFNKSFEQRTGFEWLNSDSNGVDVYVADEGCGFVFSARSFYDLMEGIQKVNHKHPLIRPKCPIFLVSGEQDPCGEFGVGVEKVAKVLRGFGYQRVMVKLYPGMRHEILLEMSREEVFGDVVSFLHRSVIKEAVH